jgi:hypothetical protein
MARHMGSGAETGTENTPPVRRPLEPLGMSPRVSPLSLAGPSLVMSRIDTSVAFEGARFAEFEEPGVPSGGRKQFVGFSLIRLTIFASTLIRSSRPWHTRIPTKTVASTRPLSMFSATGTLFHGDPCRRCQTGPASRARPRPAIPILLAPGLFPLIFYKLAMRTRRRLTLRLAREFLAWSVQGSPTGPLPHGSKRPN